MQKDIKAILDKVSSGLGTPEEQQIAKYWLHQLHQDEDAGLSDAELDALSAEMWVDIQREKQSFASKRRFLWPAVAAAVCMVLGFVSVFYFYDNSPANNHKTLNASLDDIAAGGNKAYLTLADGRKISLTDASSGTIATQAGIQITKTSNGQLIYTIADQNATGKDEQTNRIETPRGGQYRLNLPDGTRVWLNAASSLKYPVNFSSNKERIVELTGEAYFEIAKVRFKGKGARKIPGKVPFIVLTGNQKIEVLGTHFNVNAYLDEPAVRTTLLEGSVRVNERVVLKPGEQSVFDGGQVRVQAVNASDAVDWKNGEFVFTREPLTDILRKVSRWYNVDIVYKRPQQNVPTFSGSVSRFENVSVLLKMLEETSNVRFVVEDRRIIVK